MGSTAVYKWPWPETTEVADGPKASKELALAMEATVGDTGWQTYTPQFTAVGLQPANILSQICQYRVLNGWCDIYLLLLFGPNSAGGTGALQLTLPQTARAGGMEQLLSCKYWMGNNAANYFGYGRVYGGSNIVQPMFPFSNASSSPVHHGWQSSDGSGSVGTGIPRVAGQWTIQSNANFQLTGRYRTDA